MTKRFTNWWLMLLFMIALTELTYAQQTYLSIGYSHCQGVSDIAVASNGDEYVLTNTSIQVFRNNALLRSFPIEEEGRYGNDPGMTAIRIAPNGNIYAMDVSNSRVLVFSPEGQRLHIFYQIRGNPMSGQYPYSIAFDQQGNSYIADYGQDRIHVFGTNHLHLRTITSSVSLGNPVGIDLDENGNIYLLDNLTGQVRIIANDGTFIRSFPTGLMYSPHLDFDMQMVYVTDIANKQVKVFSTEGQLIRIFHVDPQPSSLTTLSSTRVYGSTIYVNDAGLGRVLRFSKDGVLQSVLGGESQLEGNLANPRKSYYVSGSQVAFGKGDYVYAVDNTKNTVQVYNKAGTFVQTINRMFENIGTIAVDDNNLLYVCDKDGARVQIFNEAGNFLKEFTPTRLAGAIAVAPSGKIFTIYRVNQGSFIQRYSAAGILEQEWEPSRDPKGITVDHESVYVVEAGNFGINVYNHDGQFQRRFGTYGSAQGSFYNGLLSLDDDRNIYLLDSDNHVSVFTNDGTFLTRYRAWGDQTVPQFSGGIGIDVRGSFNNGVIAVLDKLRLQVFPTPGASIQFEPVAEKRYGDSPFDIAVTAHRPLIFSSSKPEVAAVSGNTVNIHAPGTTTITASYATGAWTGLKKEYELTIKKGLQTITFDLATPRILGEYPFTLEATSNTETPITFLSSNQEVATLQNNFLTLMGAGTTTITAQQAETAFYEGVQQQRDLLVKLVTNNSPTAEALVSVYPNPATEYIVLKKIQETDRVELFDITGRSFPIDFVTTQEGSRANIAHLQTGLYLLKVKTPQGSYSTRLIKK